MLGEKNGLFWAFFKTEIQMIYMFAPILAENNDMTNLIWKTAELKNTWLKCKKSASPTLGMTFFRRVTAKVNYDDWQRISVIVIHTSHRDKSVRVRESYYSTVFSRVFHHSTGRGLEHTHTKNVKKKSTIIRWRLLTNRSIKSLFFLFFVFFFRQAAEAPHHATMNRRGSVLPHDTANTPPPSHNLAHTANQRSSLPTPLPGNKADREKEITPHEDVCDAVRGCWCSVGNIRLFCVD